MPLHPSRRPAHARQADELWRDHDARRGLRPLTHADRMPTALHVHVYEEGPTDGAPRRDYAGSFRYSPSFAQYLSSGLPPVAIREQRLPPRLWWQSAYLVSRLEAQFGRDGVRAVVYLHRLRAEFSRWEVEEWDEYDEQAHIARKEALDGALQRHAAITCGGGHTVEWLDRLASKFESHVWRTYYPRGGYRREQEAERRAAAG